MTSNAINPVISARRFFETRLKPEVGKEQKLTDGTSGSQRLSDGILSKADYDALKQSFCKEVLGIKDINDPKRVDPKMRATLDDKFNTFLADALDGQLDDKSVEGMFAAVKALGAGKVVPPSDGEAVAARTESDFGVNALRFGTPGKLGSQTELRPEIGKLASSADPKRIGADHEAAFEPLAFKLPVGPSPQPSTEELMRAQRGQIKTNLAALGQASGLPVESLKAFASTVVPLLDQLSPAELKGLDQKLEWIKNMASAPERRQAFTDMVTRLNAIDGPESPDKQLRIKSVLLNPPNGFVSPLPNQTNTGPAKLQLNNPEKIAAEGISYIDTMMEEPLNLGTDIKSLKIPAYGNLVKGAKIPGIRADRLLGNKDAVYQAVTVTNPGPGKVRVRVRGSGYSNSEADLLTRGRKHPDSNYSLSGPKGQRWKELDLLHPNGAIQGTRTGDLQAAIDELTEEYLFDQEVELEAGESVMLYTKVDAKTETDFRAIYQLDIKGEYTNTKPLEVTGLILGSPSGNKAVGDLLKKASAQSGALELAAGECKQLLDHLGGRDKPAFVPPVFPPFGNEKGDAFQTGYNLDFSNMSEIKAQVNELKRQGKWGELGPQGLTVGRVLGATPDSVKRSELPPLVLDGSTSYDFSYLINSKLTETLGTGDNQASLVNRAEVMVEGKPVLSNNGVYDHGNYGTIFELDMPVSNVSDQPQDLYVSLVSPEESNPEPASGVKRYASVYHPKGYKSEEKEIFLTAAQARLTAPVRITLLDENGKQVSSTLTAVTHDRFDLTVLPKLSIPAHAKGYRLKIEMPSPTNSVGPQGVLFTTTEPKLYHKLPDEGTPAIPPKGVPPEKKTKRDYPNVEWHSLELE